MREKTIAIIDSGLGGLHILKECCRILRGYNFVYVADTFNAPYGSKSKHQLKKIACDLVKNIEKKHKPEAIVFACNTLTVNAIKIVRKKFDIKFVGTEPALKQAKIFGGDIILFATKSTLKYYSKLNKKVGRQIKSEYKKQKLKYTNTDKIYKVYIPNLPLEIDQNFENLDCLTEKLKSVFDKEIYQNCTNFVLGCTHYIAIKPQLKSIFSSDIQFYDGSKAVAKRVQDIVPKLKSKKEIGIEKRIKFLTTDGDLFKKQNLIKYFNKIYTEDILPHNS